MLFNDQHDGFHHDWWGNRHGAFSEVFPLVHPEFFRWVCVGTDAGDPIVSEREEEVLRSEKVPN